MGGFATSAEIRRGSDPHRGDRTVICRLGDARVVGCVTARSQARLGVCKPDVAWIFLGGTPWQDRIAAQLGQEAVQDDEGTLECREAWNWSCEWCRPGFVEGVRGLSVEHRLAAWSGQVQALSSHALEVISFGSRVPGEAIYFL